MSTRMQNDHSTRQADPWTDEGYSEWQPQAFAIRREWMSRMGLGADEINQHCVEGTPIGFNEEMANYTAMQELEEIMQRIDEAR